MALGVQMLATRPLHEVVIDDIAAAAGISRGLLFHYFPSKREFYVAVARAAARELLACTAPDPSLPLLDQLRAGLEAFVDHVTENPDAYVSLVRGAAGSDSDLQAVFDETRAAICQRVHEALALGRQPPPSVALAVRGWVALSEEIVVAWLSDRVREGDSGTMSREQLVTMLEHALIRVVEIAPTTNAAPRS